MMMMNKNSLFLLLLFTFFLSCKQSNATLEQKNNQNKELKENLNKDERNNWLFFKTVSLSPNSYLCDDYNYNSLKFDIDNDSVFINNKYTDDVYTSSIKSEDYFKYKYLYETYKKILKQEFNIDIPKIIKTIRNKRVYDKNSELDKYFQDAFFIDNYVFFEKEGCIMCFKKVEENKVILESCIDEINFLLPYNKTHVIENITYKILKCRPIGIEKFLCGNETIRYILLPKINNVNLILIPMDCGDSPYRFYLLAIKNNKVISNLYVEGELFEPETMGNVERTNFSIDENGIIHVTTKVFIDNKIQSHNIKEFKINEDGTLN